jgi:hypothetical protein
MGYMISMIIGYEQQLLIMLSSLVTPILVILASKNMTIKEVRFMIKAIIQKK